ncbi:replication protein RepA [Idiomarina sp.]|uniref:replication protein RepA n=1 Tax=Idiomarina sp. TaxID=1874361 RepID=UPI00261C63A3|nr:replication protein RepA [Idiomarina sp.]
MYYPSLFCQLSLPMASTEQKLFFRESGKVAMQLSATSQLPYGSIARRVLFYIANHISRSGIINIPKSQASLLKALGLGTSGADVKRLKVQLQALFDMTLTVSRDQQTVLSADPLFEQSGMRYPNAILSQLSQPAKQQIFHSLTPLNKSAVDALLQTPFAFDLYTWLVWRAVSLKKPVTRISWLQLHRQFASNQNLAAFKQHFKRQLALVALAYPAITDKVMCEQDVLIMKRYQPHVMPHNTATKLSTASVG